jgi:hypothetical protein
MVQLVQGSTGNPLQFNLQSDHNQNSIEREPGELLSEVESEKGSGSVAIVARYPSCCRGSADLGADVCRAEAAACVACRSCPESVP